MLGTIQLLRSCMRTVPLKREGPALLPYEEGIIHARECLMAGRVSEIEPHWIAADVRDSWQRCLKANLDPNSPPSFEPAPATQLHELRTASARIYEIARMEVRNLYTQIAGSHFVVAFATKDATILETMADSSFSQLAQQTGIVLGSQWQESIRGTNALGCAAETLTPTVIHGPEHFFADNGQLTCVASPVLDHEDRLVGVTDRRDFLSRTCRLRPGSRSTRFFARLTSASWLRRESMIQAR